MIVFPTAYGPGRPVRLSEDTRRFAYDSLHHRYGQDTLRTPHVCMDEVAGIGEMNRLELYDATIRRIAEEAPVRICDGERISGAATLGDALKHVVPAVYHGEILFSGVSHLTANFEKVLRMGIQGMEQEVQDASARNTDPHKSAFYRSLQNTIDSFAVWHRRYLEALDPASDNYRNLQRVPWQPPRHFYEAVQSLWFSFAFLRLCGIWPGIGRIDQLLGSYLEKDLRDGVLTLEEAREILAHFFIKGCEWITGVAAFDNGSGDAQHYQNIVLAGVDAQGREVTNEVTYLVLDILEELGISDFPVTVRVNEHSPEQLLRRVAEVIRHGGGIVAVYNEPLILRSLVRTGYSLETARGFANDGCWEVQIPGHTCFSYVPFDALTLLQKKTLQGGRAHFDSYEALYAQYLCDLEGQVDAIYQECCGDWGKEAPSVDCASLWQHCTVVSLFEEGCVERGLSYLNGGADYRILSPHIGGLPDAVNSLYAIRKAVFEDHLVEFDELMGILERNWEGAESLRQTIWSRYRWWGNDNDEVDAIAADLLDTFADFCQKRTVDIRHQFIPGVSTFGRQVEWIPIRMATAFGKKQGAILSGNCSPTPGTDKEGATAVIRSYCKADLSRQASGAALDIPLTPSMVRGEEGLDALMSLIRGFVQLGGFFMQLDVVDGQTLRQAQEHPEEYATLSVRVSGWNARFVTLSREWQNMIIERDSPSC